MAKYGHGVFDTQIKEGTHWTIIEQELRRPDSCSSFLKRLLDSLKGKDDLKVIREKIPKAEHFIRIIQTKNLAITELSKPDQTPETINPEVNNVGWLGISHDERP